ncbi:MAG: phage tail protein [Leptolyngbya sp. SIO1D8]|nr:phage tail protein [Leptolyngbya sp. SIO1D8]
MVQDVSRPDLDVTVTPSELLDWSVTVAETEQMSASKLKLMPGRRCNLTVRMRNESPQSLNLQLAIGGQFPSDWFTPDTHWLQSSRERQRFTSLPFAIAPRQTHYRTLSFTLPQDFFEDPQALAHQAQLPLQYGCELFLFSTGLPQDLPQELPQASSHLVGYHPFELHTRPERVYLEFLPEIYQQSDFLGRFLNICEQALEPSFEMADLFWAYLNPLTAPKALVPFLAHWVAWPMNPRWTLSQQRKLIRHAVEIYQWRGTKRGLQFCLHLCTGLPLDDHHIQIEDAEEAGFVLGNAALSEAPCLGGGKAYHFTVILRPETPEQFAQLDETLLRTMIEQEKPAFCTYDLTITEF